MTSSAMTTAWEQGCVEQINNSELVFYKLFIGLALLQLINTLTLLSCSEAGITFHCRL